MRSELREFNEGEMQALDNLNAVLIMHDAVVVDKIRSIMSNNCDYFIIMYGKKRCKQIEDNVGNCP